MHRKSVQTVVVRAKSDIFSETCRNANKIVGQQSENRQARNDEQRSHALFSPQITDD